jgi:hypothetical protein
MNDRTAGLYGAIEACHYHGWRSLLMFTRRINCRAVPNLGWVMAVAFGFAACSGGGASDSLHSSGGQIGQMGTGGRIPYPDSSVGGNSGTGGAGGKGGSGGGNGGSSGLGGAAGGSGVASQNGNASGSGGGGNGGEKGDANADQGSLFDAPAADKPAEDVGTPDMRSDSGSTGPITHRTLISGSGTIYIIGPTGNVEWTGPDGDMDCWFLSNGNILHAYGTGARETKPDYVSGKGGTVIWDRPTVDGETHSCQPLDQGNFLVAESHNGGTSYIVEMDQSKTELKKLKVQFSATETSHTQFRQVRKLPSGNYLYCEQHGDGVEIDPTGKELHRYPSCTFEALRLANGNTLVTGGYSTQILEYDQNIKVVWQVTPADFKALGITAHFIAGVVRLDNGDIVFSNWGAPPAEAAVFQMTREKKIVWSLKQPNPTDASYTTTARILDGIPFPPAATP